MKRPLHLRKWASLLIAALVASCGDNGAREAPEATAEGAAAAPAAAPANAGGGPITASEIRSHRPSMERLRAIHQAELELARSGADDEADDEGEETVNENATAAEGANTLMRRFQERPEIRSALQRVGLTPRQAAVEYMVVGMASIASAGAGDTYSSQVSPESIEFVRANAAELKRMQDEKESAGEQPAGEEEATP